MLWYAASALGSSTGGGCVGGSLTSGAVGCTGSAASFAAERDFDEAVPIASPAPAAASCLVSFQSSVSAGGVVLDLPNSAPF